MEKEFVPYWIAVELKELGFDEPCFGYYEPNKNLNYIERHILKDFPYLAKNSEWQDLCGAPTFSAAFKFFRVKYELFHCIEPHFSSGFNIYIKGIKNDKPYLVVYKTYDEAEQECIIQLIKIAKDKIWKR